MGWQPKIGLEELVVEMFEHASEKLLKGLKCLLEKIFVAGHNGMLELLFVQIARRRVRIDYGSSTGIGPQRKEGCFTISPENKPDMVVIAAGKVGGILANSSQPVEFLLENLEIQNSKLSLGLLKLALQNYVFRLFLYIS